MSDKYILNIGCHRHTITSRDTDNREFDTREQAIESYQESKKFWASIGYVVWFAEIVSPDGTKKMLEQNTFWY